MVECVSLDVVNERKADWAGRRGGEDLEEDSCVGMKCPVSRRIRGIRFREGIDRAIDRLERTVGLKVPFGIGMAEMLQID